MCPHMSIHPLEVNDIRLQKRKRWHREEVGINIYAIIRPYSQDPGPLYPVGLLEGVDLLHPRVPVVGLEQLGDLRIDCELGVLRVAQLQHGLQDHLRGGEGLLSVLEGRRRKKKGNDEGGSAKVARDRFAKKVNFKKRTLKHVCMK